MRKINKFSAVVASAVLLSSAQTHAEDPVKVGFMLPSTGTFARLGTAIENGFMLHVNENGGKFGGREIEFVKVDSEANPAKAVDNVNKLLKQHDVDVVIGSVHSGVAMAMAKVIRSKKDVIMINPNAGANAITGPMCSPNIFRSSFSSWQPGYATGEAMAARGHKKAITITWKYAAGEEMVGGFVEAFENAGGEVTKKLFVPFPNTEFQALLTDIAAQKPDAVFAFFAGGGAVKFVKDYAAAGLKGIPLFGTGFLTDGTLEAQGDDAAGILTALHYADSLGTDRDNAFREAYKNAYGIEADVYAVQGYDAAQMLNIGLTAVKGDNKQLKEFTAAIEEAVIDSPRGEFTLSKAHNPIQDFYLREVDGTINKVVNVASKALNDPARGCRMK